MQWPQTRSPASGTIWRARARRRGRRSLVCRDCSPRSSVMAIRTLYGGLGAGKTAARRDLIRILTAREDLGVQARPSPCCRFTTGLQIPHRSRRFLIGSRSRGSSWEVGLEELATRARSFSSNGPGGTRAAFSMQAARYRNSVLDKDRGRGYRAVTLHRDLARRGAARASQGGPRRLSDRSGCAAEPVAISWGGIRRREATERLMNPMGKRDFDVSPRARMGRTPFEYGTNRIAPTPPNSPRP